MRIAFLSTDLQASEYFDRDTALVSSLTSFGAVVKVYAPKISRSSRFSYTRARILKKLGYNVFTACDPGRLHLLSRSIEGWVVDANPDIILSRSTHFTACLETSTPMVNYVDAVFNCILGLYPEFKNLDPLSVTFGHMAERRALLRSNLTILMSQWAVRKACRYKLREPYSVSALPAPAILPYMPTMEDSQKVRLGAKKPIRCIVVGKDPWRKGMDVAISAVRELRIQGLNIQLTLLGANPQREWTVEPWIEIIPPLRKGIKEDYTRLVGIMRTSHIHLLPSRADFSPHVIAETCAFGVPTIGSPVGGVPDLIDHGLTGLVARQIDDVREWVGLLDRLIREPGLLCHMAHQARLKFDSELSLPVVTRKLYAQLESVIYKSKKLDPQAGR